MHYLGTNFSLTLGAWRLRFVLALEDAPDGRESGDDSAGDHPAYDQRMPHTARVDPHTAGHRWN